MVRQSLYEQEEWFEYINWEEKIKQHREELEREERARKTRIDKSEKMEESWELLRICMGYIRENSERWKKEEKERQEKAQKEEEKRARLILAARKRENLKENLLQKKITDSMKKLPKKIVEDLRQEEEGLRRKDLKDAKLSNWKDWRDSKNVRNNVEYSKIDRLEEHLAKIEETLTKLKREENEKKAREDKERERRKNNWEEKKKAELKRNNQQEETKLRKEKKAKLEEKWAMVRWITTFIEKNGESWEKRKTERENMNKHLLEEWERNSRLQKIKILKEKIREKNNETNKNKNMKNVAEEKSKSWKNWRTDESASSQQDTTPGKKSILAREEGQERKDVPRNLQSHEMSTTPNKSCIAETTLNKAVRKTKLIQEPKLYTKLQLQLITTPATKLQKITTPAPNEEYNNQEISPKLQKIDMSEHPSVPKFVPKCMTYENSELDEPTTPAKRICILPVKFMSDRCEQGVKKSTEQVFSPTTPWCVTNNIMSDSCERDAKMSLNLVFSPTTPRMDETDMASKLSTISPPHELCVESGSPCELEMSNKCEPIIMLSARKSNITTPFKKELCKPSNMEQFLAKSIATNSPAKQNSTMPPTTPKKCSAGEEKYKKWEKSLKWNEIITQGGGK